MLRYTPPMLRSRVGAAFLLLAVVILGPLACEFLRSNGQECVKDRDCISDRCVQEICVELGASQQVPTDAATDTVTTVEAAADTPAETPADAAADK